MYHFQHLDVRCGHTLQMSLPGFVLWYPHGSTSRGAQPPLFQAVTGEAPIRSVARRLWHYLRAEGAVLAHPCPNVRLAWCRELSLLSELCDAAAPGDCARQPVTGAVSETCLPVLCSL
jgi:hypothetical protein